MFFYNARSCVRNPKSCLFARANCAVGRLGFVRPCRERCGLGGSGPQRQAAGHGAGGLELHAVRHPRGPHGAELPPPRQRRALRALLPGRALPAHRLLRHEDQGDRPAR